MVQGGRQTFETNLCVSQISERGDYFTQMLNAYILNLVEYKH